MCYGGVKLDPVRKACSSVAWITSIFNFKSIGFTALLVGCAYYGWPLIEAVFLVLGPEIKVDKIKSFLSNAPRRSSAPSRAGYSSNLEA